MKRVALYVLAVIAACPGCATIVAAFAVVKKLFLVFLLAGLGAALGLTVGPLAAIVGAGSGACIGSMLDENVALRSGELQGSGARDKELEREIAKLKSGLIDNDVKYRLLSGEVGSAMQGKAWALKWLAILAGVVFVWFCVLRKKYLWAALTKKAVLSRFWAFVHAFTGFDWTRKLAYGFDPMAVLKKREAA